MGDTFSLGSTSGELLSSQPVYRANCTWRIWALKEATLPLLGRLLGTGMQGSVWQTSRDISEPRSQEKEKKVSWIKDFLFYWPGRLLTLDGIENGPYWMDLWLLLKNGRKPPSICSPGSWNPCFTIVKWSKKCVRSRRNFWFPCNQIQTSVSESCFVTAVELVQSQAGFWHLVYGHPKWIQISG